MSDTVLSPSPALDDPTARPVLGDAPRLGETIAPTLPATAPVIPAAPEPAPILGDAAPTLPESAPVLPTAAAAPAPAPAPAAEMPVVMEMPADAPTLPEPVEAATGAPLTTGGTEQDDDGHPMAHLMPGRAAPNEASQRAAEARAAKKAKGKKIKIWITVGVVAFLAIVGPPVFKWTADAINEAGNLGTEDVAD